jgi:Domain of unknown function (DUF5069)
LWRRASIATTRTPLRMDALDLTQGPPRGPRVLLANLNLVLMARTVDKLRATLPGGNLGEYQMRGFSSHLLKKLSIEEQALREVVARAGSDDDVASWVRENSDPSQYDAINAEYEALKIADLLDNVEWMARYPIAKTLPPEMKRLDMLVLDDAELFKPK